MTTLFPHFGHIKNKKDKSPHAKKERGKLYKEAHEHSEIAQFKKLIRGNALKKAIDK